MLNKTATGMSTMSRDQNDPSHQYASGADIGAQITNFHRKGIITLLPPA
jgi:hypothetical protein